MCFMGGYGRRERQEQRRPGNSTDRAPAQRTCPKILKIAQDILRSVANVFAICLNSKL